MSYKLIAIDMDGTLITSDKKITERSIRAMQEAEAAGAYVVLASGRMAANVKVLSKDLGLHSPAICGGGSQVVDADFNILHTCYIQPEVAKQVLDVCREEGLYVQIFDDGNYIFQKHTPSSDVYHEISGLNPVEDPHLFEREHIETPKILIIEPAERLKEVQPMLKERFPMLNIGRSRPTFLELNNPEGNKGVALKILSEKLGLKQSELIAIGDNQIDASMIEYAGYGTAMGNATPKVKAAAKYETLTNDEDGVAAAIRKYVL